MKNEKMKLVIWAVVALVIGVVIGMIITNATTGNAKAALANDNDLSNVIKDLPNSIKITKDGCGKIPNSNISGPLCWGTDDLGNDYVFIIEY